MGVAVTLEHFGRISDGNHRIETPVGVVEVSLGEDGLISVENVPVFAMVKIVR